MLSKKDRFLLPLLALVSYYFLFTTPIKEGIFIGWLFNSIIYTILIIKNLKFY